MWDTGRKLRDTIIDIAPAPLCIRWEAEPAAPNTIPLRVRLAARNSVYLNYKNMPLPQLFVNSIPILLGVVGKYLFFKKSGI